MSETAVQKARSATAVDEKSTPAAELNAKLPTADFDIELQRRICQRAYEIYEQRGGAAGNELQDWLEAEAELTAATKQET